MISGASECDNESRYLSLIFLSAHASRKSSW